MTAKIPNPYETLNIERSAGLAEIKAAFRSAAKLYHPDVAGGDAISAARWAELQDAYNLLLDPDKRARYDSTGEAEAGHYSDVQIDSIAADNLGKSLDQIIDTMFDVPDSISIYMINPLDLVAEEVRKRMSKIMQDQRQLHRRCQLYERMLLVIRRKMAPGEPPPADDPVLGVLEAKVSEIKENQVRLTNSEKITSRMSALIREYSFDPANSDLRQVSGRAAALADHSTRSQVT